MTGLVRKATLLAVGGLLIASAAMAGVPSSSQSSIGSGVQWGGTRGTGAGFQGDGTAAVEVDFRVEKIITVRDAAGNPVQNSTVVIDFSGCNAVAGEYKLCSIQPFPGVLVNCPARTVTAITNAAGQAIFRVVGGANVQSANAPGQGLSPCATVRADGVLLGSVRVSTFDLNNAGGVNPADYSLYLADRFGSYRQRSDFNADGLINPADTSLFLAVRFGLPSVTSCGSSCP